MDLKAKFEAATSSTVISINELTPNRPYEIGYVERVDTKYGPTVLMTLLMTSASTAKIFLPKRYAGLFSNDDIEAIQNNTVKLQIIYLGTCPRTKSFDLVIEQVPGTS
jgi:hypothetical protein